jgi:hypothetical protein
VETQPEFSLEARTERMTEADPAKLADVRFDAEHFLREVWPRVANMDDHRTGLKTYAKSFAYAVMELTTPTEEPDEAIMVPVSKEFQGFLHDRFSDPVQVRIVDGELVFRSMKQIAGIADSGYDAWAPEDGLSA